jgi:hypothetical protein
MTQLEGVKLAGDIVVWALLFRIIEVSAQPNVYWIAKTRVQWMTETGLTLEQYKRSIRVLEKKGLVIIKIMKHMGTTMTHVRLAPTRWWETHQPDRFIKYIDHSKEVLKKESDHCIGDASIARAGELVSIEHGGIEEGNKEKEGNKENTGWLMKATEVLKNHKGGGVEGSLEAYWKSRCALVSNEYQRPLTGKERGQLKQLSKYLGTETKPVIAYAVEHWLKFSTHAAISAGTVGAESPHIGFLLKYHAVAVNLLHPVEKPPVVVELPVQSIAPVAEKVEVHAISLKELEEMLDGLKSP